MVNLYTLNKQTLNSFSSEKLLLLLKSKISKYTKNRLPSLKNDEAILNTMLGDVLTQYAINTIYQPKDSLEFGQYEKGKKFVINRPDIHFNVSHSGQYIVVAIDGQALGVDVEVHKSFSVEMIDKYFHLKEQILLNDSEKTDKTFFDLWCLKESYLKYTGLGLSLSLNSFHFNIQNKKILFFKNNIFVSKPAFKLIALDNNYSCAICTYKKSPVVTNQVSLFSLLSFLI